MINGYNLNRHGRPGGRPGGFGRPGHIGGPIYGFGLGLPFLLGAATASVVRPNYYPQYPYYPNYPYYPYY